MQDWYTANQLQLFNHHWEADEKWKTHPDTFIYRCCHLGTKDFCVMRGILLKVRRRQISERGTQGVGVDKRNSNEPLECRP
jgi:hypothetical protein